MCAIETIDLLDSDEDVPATIATTATITTTTASSSSSSAAPQYEFIDSDEEPTAASSTAEAAAQLPVSSVTASNKRRRMSNHDFLTLEDGIWCSILSFTDHDQFHHFRHLNHRFYALTHKPIAYPAEAHLYIDNDEQQMQDAADSLAINNQSFAYVTHLHLTLPAHNGGDPDNHSDRFAAWDPLLAALVQTFNSDLLPAGRHLSLQIDFDMSDYMAEPWPYLGPFCGWNVALCPHYTFCTSFHNLKEFVVKGHVIFTSGEEFTQHSASTLEVLEFTLFDEQPSQAFLDSLPSLTQLKRLILHHDGAHPPPPDDMDWTPLTQMSTTLQYIRCDVLGCQQPEFKVALQTLRQRLPALVIEPSFQMKRLGLV